jgi:hypothetical protein
LLFAHHLDYISCVLTVLSTLLVGRRLWQGWIVAGVNSVIISWIGLRTGQWGFVPANVFCLAMYLYNVKAWRSAAPLTAGAAGLSRRGPTMSDQNKGPIPILGSGQFRLK